MFDATFGQNNHSKCEMYKFTVGEMSSPRLDQSTTRLIASWFVGEHECYYLSMKTEKKSLLALFSVRQGRWVYLFSEMTYIVSGGALNSTHSLTHLIDWGSASPAQCTLYGNP